MAFGTLHCKKYSYIFLVLAQSFGIWPGFFILYSTLLRLPTYCTYRSFGEEGAGNVFLFAMFFIFCYRSGQTRVTSPHPATLPPAPTSWTPSTGVPTPPWITPTSRHNSTPAPTAWTPCTVVPTPPKITHTSEYSPTCSYILDSVYRSPNSTLDHSHLHGSHSSTYSYIMDSVRSANSSPDHFHLSKLRHLLIQYILGSVRSANSSLDHSHL